MTAIAWFMKNWRLVLGGVLTVTVLLAWAYASHLRHIVQAQKAQIARDATALKAASSAIAARDAKILAGAAQESADATETSTFWKGQSRAAFDAGYAAHRCPGEPRGVRPDLRTVWQAGAFQPSAPAVSGKPNLGH